ncbi:MAG: sporulation transcriptional regulator SpoIIID [Clostridia bacterium]
MKSKILDQEMLEKMSLYMIQNKCTVRQLAKKYDIPKSTVYTKLTKDLYKQNFKLYLMIKEILSTNKQERAMRGGLATREKYLKQNK